MTNIFNSYKQQSCCKQMFMLFLKITLIEVDTFIKGMEIV
jgi:hypothetical protein